MIDIEYIRYSEAQRILEMSGWNGVVTTYFPDKEVKIPEHVKQSNPEMPKVIAENQCLTRESLLLQLAYENNLNLTDISIDEGKSFIEFKDVDVDLLQNATGRIKYSRLTKYAKKITKNISFKEEAVGSVLKFLGEEYFAEDISFCSSDEFVKIKINLNITTDDNLYSVLKKICDDNNFSWIWMGDNIVYIIQKKYRLGNTESLFHFSRVLSYSAYLSCFKFIKANGLQNFISYYFKQISIELFQKVAHIVEDIDLNELNVTGYRENITIGEFILETISIAGGKMLKISSKDTDSLAGLTFNDIPYQSIGDVSCVDIYYLAKLTTPININADIKTISEILVDISNAGIPYNIDIDQGLLNKSIQIEQAAYSFTELLDIIVNNLEGKKAYWNWLGQDRIVIKATDLLLYSKPKGSKVEVLFTPIYNSKYFTIPEYNDEKLLNFTTLKSDLYNLGLVRFVEKYINTKSDSLRVVFADNVEGEKNTITNFSLPHFFKKKIDLGEFLLKTLWVNQLKVKFFNDVEGRVIISVGQRRHINSYSHPSVDTLVRFTQQVDQIFLYDIISNNYSLEYALSIVSSELPVIRFIAEQQIAKKKVELSMPLGKELYLTEMLDLLAYQTTSDWEFINENTIVFYRI